MCLTGELREMHTLIERPLGQRKYLRENENFIHEALLTQTRKKKIYHKASWEMCGKGLSAVREEKQLWVREQHSA